MKQYWWWAEAGGLSGKKIKCFLSYAHVDKEFVYKNILPLLERYNISVWLDINELSLGDSIVNQIVKGIREADIVISILNIKSTYVNLELGAALGTNKPIIALVNESQWKELPSDLNAVYVLRYNENNFEKLRDELDKEIATLLEQVIDKATFQQELQSKESKIIGISVGDELDDFELELRFTLDFIEFIKQNNEQANISLLQPSRGSLKNLIKVDFKSWAELLEKIIFIIPELKKRKSERMKVDAEVEKIKAETLQINTETNIKQAETFVNLLEKYQKLGIKIQIDDDLLITQNSAGMLTFKEPKKLD
jgi:nucleoside 2-deoxyribosyltransferase